MEVFKSNKTVLDSIAKDTNYTQVYNPGILRDRTMADRLMYIPNDQH